MKLLRRKPGGLGRGVLEVKIMRKKKIEIPLYFGDLIIIQTNDIQKINKKYNLGLSKSIFIEAVVFVNPKKSGWSRYYMVFGEVISSRTIAHESNHAVNRIFLDRSIDLDHENDDPQCYLLGWIVAECHKFLKVDDSML